MPFEKRYSQEKKLEIVEVSQKIGLRQAEKVYGVTKKTIISWKKKYQTNGNVKDAINEKPVSKRLFKITPEQKAAIFELYRNNSRISASEIIRRLELSCSLQTVYKILKKESLLSSFINQADSWLLNSIKISYGTNHRTAYLLTATEISTGITLVCTTEENISINLNAFAEYLLGFFKKIGQYKNLQIIIQSGRFKTGKQVLPVSSALYKKFPEIAFAHKKDSDLNQLQIPEAVKNIIKIIPADISQIDQLNKFLNENVFLTTILQLSKNDLIPDPKILLFRSQNIDVNFNSDSILASSDYESVSPLIKNIMEIIKSDLEQFNLENIDILFNYLDRIVSQTGDLNFKIEMDLLLGRLCIKKFNSQKAGFYYTKAMRTDHYKRCKKLLDKILKICRDGKFRDLECEVIGEIGSVYHSENNPQAKVMFDMQLELALELDNKVLFCMAMNHLSNYYYFSGEYEKGYQSAQKSLAVATKSNDGIAIFHANYFMAQYGIFSQKTELAAEYLNRNVEYCEKRKLRAFLAKTLTLLGYVRCRQNDFSAGLALLEKGLALAKQIGNRFDESQSYSLLGQSYLIKQDYKKAAFNLNKAAKINIEINNKDQQITVYGNLITCYIQLGQISKASRFAHKKYEAVKHTGNNMQIALALGKIGSCALYVNKFSTALKYYLSQLEILKKTDAVFPKGMALGNVGHIYLDNKDYKQAADYYLKARKQFAIINNHRYLGMVYLQLAIISKETGNDKNLKKYAILCREEAALCNDRVTLETIDKLLV